MPAKKAAVLSFILVCSVLLIADMTIPIQAQQPTTDPTGPSLTPTSPSAPPEPTQSSQLTPTATSSSPTPTSTSVTPNITVQDDFDDGMFNSVFWEKLAINGGQAQETDGQLTLTVPSGGMNWSQVGYVTKRAYSLQQGFEVSVDITELNDLAEMNLFISDQKDTTIDPAHVDNWYRIVKMKESYFPGHNLITVEHRLAGFERTIEVNRPWDSATGQLKIAVSIGQIIFYENGVKLYSERYNMPSDEVYVYIYTSTSYEYPGTDKLDNFTLQASDASLPTLAPTAMALAATSQASPNIKVDIIGALTANATAIANAQVLLSYSINAGVSWIDLTTLTTDAYGAFQAAWTPQVTGNYLIKAVYQGDSQNQPAENTVPLTITPLQQSNFVVDSNSTITQLYFNSTANQLSFTASGPTGTTGYANINIPKTLIPDITNLQVNLDQNPLPYTVIEQNDTWLVTFTYHHSTHQITLSMGNPQTATSHALPLGFAAALAVFVIAAIAVVVDARKQKIP